MYFYAPAFTPFVYNVNMQTLQVTFYIMGIIFMSIQIVLFIIVIILLFYIKAKVTEVTKMVEERIEEVKNIIRHPGEIAATVGTAVATTAINKVSDIMRSKKKKESRN
jgi:uncharacterized membrane protein